MDIHGLVEKAKSKPSCTIARRVIFFNSLYYIPYTGILTCKEVRGGWEFTHPAFKGGMLFTAWAMPERTLRSVGYIFLPKFWYLKVGDKVTLCFTNGRGSVSEHNATVVKVLATIVSCKYIADVPRTGEWRTIDGLSIYDGDLDYGWLK